MVRILILLAFFTVGLASPPAEAQRRRSTKKVRRAKKKQRTKKKRRRARTPKRSKAGPFAKGRKRFSLQAHRSTQFGSEYLVVGVGLGYYVADGWLVGLAGQKFFGDGPDIYNFSPEVRYTFWQADLFKPYVGAYYRYQSVGEVNSVDQPDNEFVGGRVGLYTGKGKGHAGFGLAYEQLLDCTETATQKCTQLLPELTLALSF